MKKILRVAGLSFLVSIISITQVIAAGEPYLVKDINPFTDYDEAGISNLTAVGGILCFIADDGVHGYQLWKSDGTEAGTVIVKYINPEGCSVLGGLINVDDTLYFIADDGTHGTALWKSDGTAEGTIIVKTLNPFSGNFTNVNEILYFTSYDEICGVELWKSNGTEEGMFMVKDINLEGSSDPWDLINERLGSGLAS